MSSPAQTITWPQLLPVCRRAVHCAQEKGGPIIASLITATAPVDALRVYATHRCRAVTRMLWGTPQSSLVLVGLGVAAEITGTGAERYAVVNRYMRHVWAHSVIEGSTAAANSGPLFLGGFAFNSCANAPVHEWIGFPAAYFFLPRLLVTCTDNQTWLTTNVQVQPGDTPNAVAEKMAEALSWTEGESAVNTVRSGGSRDHLKEPLHLQPIAPMEWKQSVARTAQRIQAGLLEKVVLARAVHAYAPQAFAPVAALAYLQEAYQNCYLFAINRGERCFLGASPEQLVRLENGTVHTMCLAGSIPRGTSPLADANLGEQLLASAKDWREHKIVVDDITANLAKVCTSITAPPTPTLLRLPNVQHLHTPVTAQLAPGRSVLDVVECLHPTPAMGGYPRAAALAEIAASEPVDRGWYAAPVGWVGHTGAGEFAVAIRSALVAGARATLYAGCGILGDSDPEAEFEESCLKLRPMLAALEASAE